METTTQFQKSKRLFMGKGAKGGGGSAFGGTSRGAWGGGGHHAGFVPAPAHYHPPYPTGMCLFVLDCTVLNMCSQRSHIDDS